MKKINVLHLLTSSNIRGSEKLVIDMADQSNSNMFNYLVCTLYPSGDLHKLATKKKILLNLIFLSNLSNINM